MIFTAIGITYEINPYSNLVQVRLTVQPTSGDNIASVPSPPKPDSGAITVPNGSRRGRKKGVKLKKYTAEERQLRKKQNEEKKKNRIPKKRGRKSRRETLQLASSVNDAGLPRRSHVAVSSAASTMVGAAARATANVATSTVVSSATRITATSATSTTASVTAGSATGTANTGLLSRYSNSVMSAQHYPAGLPCAVTSLSDDSVESNDADGDRSSAELIDVSRAITCHQQQGTEALKLMRNSTRCREDSKFGLKTEEYSFLKDLIGADFSNCFTGSSSGQNCSVVQNNTREGPPSEMSSRKDETSREHALFPSNTSDCPHASRMSSLRDQPCFSRNTPDVRHASEMSLMRDQSKRACTTFSNSSSDRRHTSQMTSVKDQTKWGFIPFSKNASDSPCTSQMYLRKTESTGSHASSSNSTSKFPHASQMSSSKERMKKVHTSSTIHNQSDFPNASQTTVVRDRTNRVHIPFSSDTIALTGKAKHIRLKKDAHDVAHAASHLKRKHLHSIYSKELLSTTEQSTLTPPNMILDAFECAMDKDTRDRNATLSGRSGVSVIDFSYMDQDDEFEFFLPDKP